MIALKIIADVIMVNILTFVVAPAWCDYWSLDSSQDSDVDATNGR